jgi:hypothetical protein
MKSGDLNDVIATRVLELRLSSGETRPLTISIGRPERFLGENVYFCQYRIVGAGSARVKYAAGTDGIQALQLVMPMIDADLFLICQQYGGALKWEGSDNIGFPEAANR